MLITARVMGLCVDTAITLSWAASHCQSCPGPQKWGPVLLLQPHSDCWGNCKLRKRNEKICKVKPGKMRWAKLQVEDCWYWGPEEFELKISIKIHEIFQENKKKSQNKQTKKLQGVRGWQCSTVMHLFQQGAVLSPFDWYLSWTADVLQVP